MIQFFRLFTAKAHLLVALRKIPRQTDLASNALSAGRTTPTPHPKVSRQNLQTKKGRMIRPFSHSVARAYPCSVRTPYPSLRAFIAATAAMAAAAVVK